MTRPSPFTLKAIGIMKKIPRGRVATYGQIARLAGHPGASRAMVWILHSSTKKYRLPWQRVINAQGKIAFDPSSTSFIQQWHRLSMEGVVIDRLSGKIDLKKYQWKKGLLKR